MTILTARIIQGKWKSSSPPSHYGREGSGSSLGCLLLCSDFSVSTQLGSTRHGTGVPCRGQGEGFTHFWDGELTCLARGTAEETQQGKLAEENSYKM